MRTRKNLFAATALILCCVIVALFSTSIQGGYKSRKSYTVEPYINMPYATTDTARLIDSYERLMARYMDITETNSKHTSAVLTSINKKLDSIDARLTKLTAKMASFEKALSIHQIDMDNMKSPDKPKDTTPESQDPNQQ